MRGEDPLEAIVGVKLMVAVAGFLGGVLQLAFNRTLTLPGAILSVLAGVCCASFGTPLANWYWSLPPAVENGIAFLFGLLGMLLTGKVYQFASGLSIERVLEFFKGGPR